MKKVLVFVTAVMLLQCMAVYPAAGEAYPDDVRLFTADSTLVNLAADGDGTMDSQSGYSCHQNGTVSYITEEGNTYLVHTPTAYSILWLTDATLQSEGDRKYWYSFDGKSTTLEWVNLWKYSVSGGSAGQLTGNWETFTGELESAEVRSNKLGVFPAGSAPYTPYCIDNVKVYDITNAYNITIASGSPVELAEGSTVTMGSNIKANAGDTVRFTVETAVWEQIQSVTVNGEPVQESGGIYSFEMPAQDVTVSAVVVEGEEPRLVNLIPDGDMESGNTDFYAPSSYTGIQVYYEQDENGNTYLCLDATQNENPSWANSLIRYPYAPKAGNTYYYTFRAKCSEETAEAVSNSGSNLWFSVYGTDVGASHWMPASDFAVCNGIFTLDTDSTELRWLAQYSSNPQLANQAKYYLDDVQVYNITGAKAISYSAAGAAIQARAAEDCLVDTLNQKVYAMPGTTITFDVSPVNTAGKVLRLEGLTQVSETEYTYTVGETDAEVSVAYLDSVTYEVIDGQLSVTAVEAGERTIIAAGYTDGALSEVWTGDAATSEPDQTVMLTPVLDSLENAVIYCWDGLETMNPQRRVYKNVPDAQIFLAGDSTCVDYSSSSAIQGWGSFFEPMVKTGSAVINEAVGGATIGSFLEGSRYTDMKEKWQSGDYLLIAFGINDSGVDKPSVQEYKEKVTRLVQEAKAAGVTPVLIKEQHGAAYSKSEKFASLMAALDEIAAAEQTAVVDLYTATEAMPDYCRSADGVHLTRAGAQYVAEILTNVLQSVDTDLKYYI